MTDEPTMKDSGERREFGTGAVRDRGGFKPRPDLISPHANMREGAWLAKGAEKYGIRNYEKGMPISECVASLTRHLEAYKLGLQDEDHMAAIRTNAGFILHYEEEIKAGRLPASLDDMPKYADRPGLTPIQLADLVQTTLDSAPPEVQQAIREARIQAKLDETFKDKQAVYALVDLRRGDEFMICGKLASTDYADFPADTACYRGYAREDIPAGAPMRVSQSDAPNNSLWEVAVGYQCPDGAIFAKFNRPMKANEVVMAVDLAQPGSEMTAAQIIDSDGRVSDGHIYAAASQAKPDFTVYLCGPITGQEVDYTWREAATVYLQAHGIHTLNPLRGKKKDQISNLGLGYKGQLAAPEIADRDQMDVEECNVVLAHFPYEPPRQSIGSLMEMGAAAIGLHKTVILCATPQVFNDHLFCRNFCTLEPNFQAALDRIVAMAQAKRR